MRVPTVTPRVFKEPEPWGAHSQESHSLRRQHLPWVTMAGRRQAPPKMPTHEEANAPPQPNSRLPGLQNRRQVRDGAGGGGRWWDGATRSCLSARAGLAATVGAAVPRQPPPVLDFSSSCPQMGHRRPLAAPQDSQGQASSPHGNRLRRLPCPQSSQAAGSRRAQVGSPREPGTNVFPSPGAADRQAGAAGGDGRARSPSKLSPPSRACRLPGHAGDAPRSHCGPWPEQCAPQPALGAERQLPVGPSAALGAGRGAGTGALPAGTRGHGRRATVTQPLSSPSLADGQPGVQGGNALHQGEAGGDSPSASKAGSSTTEGARSSGTRSCQHLLQAPASASSSLCSFCPGQGKGQQHCNQQTPTACPIYSGHPW